MHLQRVDPDIGPVTVWSWADTGVPFVFWHGLGHALERAVLGHRPAG